MFQLNAPNARKKSLRRLIVAYNSVSYFNESWIRISQAFISLVTYIQQLKPSANVGNQWLGSLMFLNQGYILYIFIWTTAKHHISYVNIFTHLKRFDGQILMLYDKYECWSISKANKRTRVVGNKKGMLEVKLW